MADCYPEKAFESAFLIDGDDARAKALAYIAAKIAPRSLEDRKSALLIAHFFDENDARKGLVLSSIAQAIANIDLDGALEIADNNKKYKDVIFAGIAPAIAPQKLDKALRILDSIEDNSLKTKALENLIKALAELNLNALAITHFKTLLKRVLSLEDNPQKSEILLDFAKAIIELNLDGAIEILDSTESCYELSVLYAIIDSAAALKHMDKIRKIIEGLELEGAKKKNALNICIKALIEVDFEEALRLAYLCKQSMYIDTLVCVFEALAEKSLERAFELLAMEERYTKDLILQSIVKVLVKDDPKKAKKHLASFYSPIHEVRAVGYYAGAIAKNDLETAQKCVDPFTGEFGDIIRHEIIKSIAKEKTQEALDLAQNNTEKLLIAEAIVTIDPDRALELLKSQKENFYAKQLIIAHNPEIAVEIFTQGEVTDARLLHSKIKEIAKTDLPRGLTLANSIKPLWLRVKVLAKLSKLAIK
jgi:hypothetical protein